ncbi:PIN domain-containing protein [Aminivibrio sp.]
MSDFRGIDANIILRFLLKDDAELSPCAREILLSVQDERLRVFCDPVNFAEVVWVLSSFYKVGRREIRDLLLPLLQLENFILPDKERMMKALELFALSVPHFGDACLCAAAIDMTEGEIISFDKKMKSVKGISCIGRY